MNLLARLALLFAIFFSASCSDKALSRNNAKALLDAHPLLTGLTPIAVEGISQGSTDAEAIARASISQNALNLKFRRYDDGWRWEFVETNGGGWIAPAIAVKDIREQHRKVRAVAWANQHKPQYEKTVSLINAFSDNLPRNTEDSFDIGTWQRHRDLWRRLTRSNKTQSAEWRLQRLDELENTNDSSGREFMLNFNNDRSAVFLSTGFDAQKGTPDDVVVLVRGFREWDDLYDKLMFNYYKSWQLPEGLEDIARPFAAGGIKGGVTGSKVMAQ